MVIQMKTDTIEHIKRFIENESETSKIYIGCDSESYKRHGVRYADYYVVVVIHKNGRNGCKIFGEKITEADYTANVKKPTYRLMNEVYKAAQLYLELAESIGDREVEIHLDINSNRRHASSAVLDQAVGYIKQSCNIVPLVKPHSWAATHCADKLLKNVNAGVKRCNPQLSHVGT
jgi:predicted RNase H-related nuclease YkuK (DUF458 family)